MPKRTTSAPSDLTPNKRVCAADALSSKAYQSITVVLLKVELHKRGIVYDKKSRKAALITLLTTDDEKPPAQVIEPPTGPRICCVCMDNEANAKLNPCNHSVCCVDCTKKIRILVDPAQCAVRCL
jgi:hypothetical protein